MFSHSLSSVSVQKKRHLKYKGNKTLQMREKSYMLTLCRRHMTAAQTRLKQISVRCWLGSIKLTLQLPEHVLHRFFYILTYHYIYDYLFIALSLTHTHTHTHTQTHTHTKFWKSAKFWKSTRLCLPWYINFFSTYGVHITFVHRLVNKLNVPQEDQTHFKFLFW